MSDNLNSKKVALLGPGYMGVEYGKVLQYLDVPCSVIGRSWDSVERFNVQTGMNAIAGGLQAWKKKSHSVPNMEYAIVAVNVEELSHMAIELMDLGIRKILLEKPGAINTEELRRVRDKARETETKILVAYNRRFYASVLKAQEIIRQDGGITSFNFEFTEWVHTIPDHIKAKVKKNWFLANSSHVADLAFFLGGEPKDMTAFAAGGCD